MFFGLWKKILIILGVLALNTLSSIVVIDFDRVKDIYSDDDDEVSSNILKNDIYCNMTVGEQIIPFLISFDKQVTFIVDSNYTFSKYQKNKSPNFKKKSEKYNSYFFEYLQIGYNATDNFNLKDEDNKKIEVFDMPFILGTYIESQIDFQFPAALGLKKKTYQNPQIFNFIENLKLKGIINSQVFFLNLMN